MLGLVGIVLQLVWAAIATVAALLTDCTLVVERTGKYGLACGSKPGRVRRVNVRCQAGECLQDTLPTIRAIFLPGEGRSCILKRWGTLLTAPVA